MYPFNSLCDTVIILKTKNYVIRNTLKNLFTSKKKKPIPNPYLVSYPHIIIIKL